MVVRVGGNGICNKTSRTAPIREHDYSHVLVGHERHMREEPRKPPEALQHRVSVVGREIPTMVWTIENGQLRVRMGMASSEVEVFDGTEHQLRVELTGGGTVVTFRVEQGDRQPLGLQYLSYEFVRVQ